MRRLALLNLHGRPSANFFFYIVRSLDVNRDQVGPSHHLGQALQTLGNAVPAISATNDRSVVKVRYYEHEIFESGRGPLQETGQASSPVRIRPTADCRTGEIRAVCGHCALPRKRPTARPRHKPPLRKPPPRNRSPSVARQSQRWMPSAPNVFFCGALRVRTGGLISRSSLKGSLMNPSGKRCGPGRPRGLRNRFTAEIQHTVSEAFEKAG